MLISKENVIEKLSNNKVVISTFYPLNKKAHFILLTDIHVILSDGEIINIEKGFTFDGSSVPRFLWWAFPPYGNFLFAAVLHDWFYVKRHRSNIIGTKQARKFADKEMLIWSNLLNNSNFGKKADNYIRYLAVRLFGKRQYLN
jgi:hypothetical protein